MRLATEQLDTASQILEFNQWLTPKLGRIKDTPKFTHEIETICDCVCSLTPHLNDFAKVDDCNAERICIAVVEASQELIEGKSFVEDEKRVTDFLNSFFNLLFLVSGATDNNLKNHFLIQLKHDDVKPLMPKRGLGKKSIKFKLVDIPPTTKSDAIARVLAGCAVGVHSDYASSVRTEPAFDLEIYLKLLLEEYVRLILETSEEIYQFWAVCSSFTNLNRQAPDKNMGRYLLNACTIFKVRGSVSASGGHEPENILREKLLKIGLEADRDFNTNDVTIGEEEVEVEGKRKKKTRAYDFIIPYQVECWEPKPKLFIQSQFYAGDSGSVSHKVVDQTTSSRAFTLNKYPNARFVEYLDGAGYYAALSGDLEHMLSFSSTASFFQVKSIFIRLRRELQQIKFVTPIEVEHAILTDDGATKDSVIRRLVEDGYDEDEVARVLRRCLDVSFINEANEVLELSDERVEISRRLLTLDLAANHAEKISDEQRKTQKYLLVPGRGANMAILESELSKLTLDELAQKKPDAPTFSEDIEWLLDEGVLQRR